MSRYFTAPRAPRLWVQEQPYDWQPVNIAPVTVDETLPTNTGLIDEDGAPIMKSNDPIGFIR